MSNYSPKHPSSGGSRTAKSDGDKKKQKILITVILIVLAVIIAVALILAFVPGAESGIVGIFNNSSKSSFVPETQDGTTNLTPYYQEGMLPTAADRHDIDIIYGGGAQGSDLYGRWQMNDHDTYIFDGQGRGIFLAINNSGDIDKEFTFTYSAENGKLGIDYDGQSGFDYEYDYTLDGDTLTLTRDGNTYTMKRVADE